jgi:hypothetical protein
MSGYGDNFMIVVPVEEGDILHTAEHPFCPDPDCPCHEDQTLIAGVNDAYMQGLVTLDEATRIVEGRSLG